MNILMRPANILSLGNALCGTLAIFFIAYDPLWSIRLIILGMMFDAFDGTVARWQGPTEEGKWLDRIGDRITQAIAPSALMVAASSFHPLAFFAGALFVMVSMIRIVRTDAAQASTVGLPMWPITFLIIFGVLGRIDFLIFGGVITAAVVLSFLPLPYRLPWAVRKPEIKKQKWGAVGVILLRAIPLTALLYLASSSLVEIPFYAFWILGCGALLWTAVTIFCIPKKKQAKKARA